MLFREEGHLGGYVVGGDPMCWCPRVWDDLISATKAESVVDVGCGEGHALRYFQEKGLRAIGVEGIPQDDSSIIHHDYTKGPLEVGPVDLAWSCEFVEHVEERYISNFLKTFSNARVVAMTHGLPGQPGWHHVNCQLPSYWLDVMGSIGYKLNAQLTFGTRDLAPGTWWEKTGLVFER